MTIGNESRPKGQPGLPRITFCPPGPAPGGPTCAVKIGQRPEFEDAPSFIDRRAPHAPPPFWPIDSRDRVALFGARARSSKPRQSSLKASAHSRNASGRS
jgi:hypothetical protein